MKIIKSAAIFLALGSILLLSTIHIQTNAATLRNVSLILPVNTDNAGEVFVYVSQGLGFFAQEGIELSLEFSQGTGEAAALGAAGKGDFALTDPVSVMSLVSKGVNFQSVFNSGQGEITKIVVLDDSPYKQITDLKGKDIGVSFLGAVPHYVLLRELKLAGMSEDSVNVVPLGLGSAAAEALFQRKVAASVTPSYGTLLYLSQSRGIKVRTIPAKSNPLPSYTIATTPTHMSDRETVIKVGRALAKGLVYLTSNSSAANDVMGKMHPELMSNREMVDFNSKYLASVYYADRSHPAGWHDPDAWSETQKVYQSLGVIPAVDPQKCYTNEFINSMNDFDKAAVERMAQPQSTQAPTGSREILPSLLAFTSIAIIIAAAAIILKRSRRAKS